MKNIRYFVILLAVFFSIESAAQEMYQYEEVLKKVETVDMVSAILMLRNFQKLDPSHPVNYYEIGKRYAKIISQINPVTESNQFGVVGSNISLYYDLSMSKMDDKLIKKYRNLLTDIRKYSGEKYPTLNDYNQTLREQLDSFKIIINNGFSTKYHFTEFVQLYEKCISQFRNINDEFPNLKVLYLIANPALLSRLDTLEITFDSCLVQLEKYRTISKNFEGVLYSPNYELLPISKYKMDGMTGMNYLSPQLQLWDYKGWVENFKLVLETDIKELRRKIEADDRNLDANIQYFSINDEFNDNMKYFKTKQELRNLIKKFDYSPLPVDLFDYKMSKLNLLVNTRKQINNPAFTPIVQTFNDRLNYYFSLTNEKIQLNDQLVTLSNNINDENIARYSDYFNLYYKGKEGLLKFCENELKNNDQILNNTFTNLKRFVLQEENKNRDSYKFIKYNGIDLPLFIENYNIKTLSKGEYRSAIIERIGYSNLHIVGGVYVVDGQKIQPYVMCVDSFNLVKWFTTDLSNKTTNVSFKNTVPISFKIISEDKIMVLLHSWNTDSLQALSANTIVELNGNGQIVKQLVLDRSEYPRYFSFDDINEEYILAYKGNFDNLQVEELEPITISLYDSLAVKLWDFNFDLKGSLIDLVQTNNDFLLFFNFNQYNRSWNKNELIKMKDESAAFNNVMSIYLDHSGKVVSNQNYQAVMPYFGVKVIKLNSKTINLIAFQGDKPKEDYRNFIYNNKLNYLLTKPSGEVIFSNFTSPAK